jgi:hypothetical protein
VSGPEDVDEAVVRDRPREQVGRLLNGVELGRLDAIDDGARLR